MRSGSGTRLCGLLVLPLNRLCDRGAVCEPESMSLAGSWRAWYGDLNHIATSQETQKENPVSAAIVSVMDPLLRWATTKEDAMIENEPNSAGRRKQRLAGAVGLLLAGGLVGGVLAATNSASAADTTT